MRFLCPSEVSPAFQHPPFRACCRHAFFQGFTAFFRKTVPRLMAWYASSVRYPLLGLALRSFLVMPYPSGFPKAPFLPLRCSTECCPTDPPAVLPPDVPSRASAAPQGIQPCRVEPLPILTLLNFTPITRVCYRHPAASVRKPPAAMRFAPLRLPLTDPATSQPGVTTSPWNCCFSTTS
jgi:hypothetical protein